MSFALWFLIIVFVLSAVYSLVLIREYLRVTRKRRKFIAVLGGSGRAVPHFKHTLMTVYIVSTAVWTAGLCAYFFYITQL